MREEKLLIGSEQEIIDYYNSLNVIPKDFTHTESAKMEMAPIKDQIKFIMANKVHFGMIYWLEYRVGEAETNIAIGTQFVWIAEHGQLDWIYGK